MALFHIFGLTLKDEGKLRQTYVLFIYFPLGCVGALVFNQARLVIHFGFQYGTSIFISLG
jgi:hypothetical protein